MSTDYCLKFPFVWDEKLYIWAISSRRLKDSVSRRRTFFFGSLHPEDRGNKVLRKLRNYWSENLYDSKSQLAFRNKVN